MRRTGMGEVQVIWAAALVMYRESFYGENIDRNISACLLRVCEREYA